MPGLQKVAAVLVVPGEGILAADASIATMFQPGVRGGFSGLRAAAFQ